MTSTLTPVRPGSAQELAEEALALCAGSPRDALARAESALHRALAEADRVAESTAHRAAALALCELGDRTAARQRAGAAVAIAARAGAVECEAQARMLLAYVLAALGMVRAGLREADRAAAALDGLPAAQMVCQRALILQEAGRLDEATAAYGAAIPQLRLWGDKAWQARALNNRSVVHAYSGRLADAETDLHEAFEIHRDLGLDRAMANGELNLGFVASRRGDAPAALERYLRAEQELVRLDVPTWRLLMCQFEVLLAVGLIDEGRQTVERAAELLAGSGNAADLAEVRLLLAQVALAEGDAQRAREDGRAAREMFRRQERPGWELVARFMVLRADELADAAPRRLLRTAQTCAAALAHTGWRVAELDARLVAARAALRAGDVAVATEELSIATAARRSGSLELRVRAWHATALLREAQGDTKGTRSALRAGLGVVDRYRAGLGATDLRAHVAGHAVALAAKGLELALADGAPVAVLTWADRWRAGTVALRPVRPPDDPELADALAEVRRLSARQVEAQVAGRPGPSIAAVRTAEQRVVTASRTARSALHQGGAPPPRRAELAAALGDAVLVEFVRHGTRMLAVTMRAGRCVLHELGAVDAVESGVAAAQFALRRMSYRAGSERSGRLQREAARTAGARLDALLIDPLLRELGDRPAVVVPTGHLHPLPWALLPSMAARTVRVAPSASSWLAATRRGAATGSGRIVVAAGPRLAAADGEAVAVARHYPGVVPLLGAEATAPALLAALDGAELAHVAAHGTLRTDNPLFSALELADGPLSAYDLERLGVAPRVVVLPACHSGASAVRPGDEVMGLVAVLLALGTRTVIAPVLPVADAATAPLMDALHAGLCRGESPAAAMAAARVAADPDDPGSVAAAAVFTCFGA